MAQPALKVIPLGGLGEIGKNMMVLEFANDIIVIDAGVMFPEEDTPGVDLILPNITYLKEHRDRIRGILITHGHEDHAGGLPYLLPHLGQVPVYASRLTRGLISVKLKEHRLQRDSRVVEVPPGREIKLGAFRAEFFRVCHSIPDAMGISIRTPLGQVIHTGDFKIDHTPVDGQPSDFPKLAELASEGVFLLFSDSTYAEVPGYTPSEQVVGEALDRVIGEAKGRVMVATFASLISRIQQVLDAAAHHNRKVAVVGRSMVGNVSMALEMGYLKDPGVLAQWNEIRRLPPERVVLIATGSQGEPTSALVRIANRDHEIRVMPGDTVVISASPIPGNEILISRAIDNLGRQGAQVLHSRIAMVHVHGHASQEELKLMLNITRPRYFVPVHGEYRHLAAHAQLAQSMGVPQEQTFTLEDGDLLTLTREGSHINRRQVNAEHVYVDGSRTYEVSSGVLKDRQALSHDGVVLAVVALSKTTGELARRPEVLCNGVADEETSRDLAQRSAEKLEESLNHLKGIPLNSAHASFKVKEVLGQLFRQETALHPVILPVILEV
ncbi:MAG: ribonuclease J [Chloroflexi bacterium]|nr:ribonuclease J [Chloroflexota bacterium]